jgi:hypothetical protein
MGLLVGLRNAPVDLRLPGVISFGRKVADPRKADDRPHGYKPGFGYTSYCLALLPSGIHCGRHEMDPIHTVDDRSAFRNTFRRSG